MHYHAEVSLPACMPDWIGTYQYPDEAVAALKDVCDNNEDNGEVTINVIYSTANNEIFLAVARWKDKPSTLNCYAYNCSEDHCMEGGDNDAASLA